MSSQGLPSTADYHPKAGQEIRAALARFRRMDREYVPGKSTLAPDFLAALEGADWKVSSKPHRWAPYMFGTRRVRLPSRWRFGLVYLPEGAKGGPVVVALAHYSRRPGYWRDRVEELG